MAILATLALPRFKTFQGKARQSEAKTMLNNIHSLQAIYFDDRSEYAVDTTSAAYGLTRSTTAAWNCTAPASTTWAGMIGFVLNPCANVVRYGYSQSAGTTTTYTAVAATGTGAGNLVMPGCSVADSWNMTQDKVIASTSTTSDAVKNSACQ